MKKNFGFFAAVLVIAAGCAKEIAPSLNDQVTVLTAGVEATKTVLDGNKVYWTAGDRISVNGVASEALAIDSPSATADFTFVGTLDAPYKAVFPASIYKDANTVVMPSVQEYAEESFHSQASPMIAYSTAGNLSFSHPFSVVCLSINLKEDTDKISYVEFSGNDGEQVCGDFTVDYDAKTLTGTGADSGNKSVRVNVGKALSADGPVLVHIVVPAIKYSKGFSVKIADEKGHFMKKSVTAERDCKAGKVYDMTAFDFVPTDTELNVDIASASDLIAFATKWNAGEYTSSADSPLVVNLTQDIAFSEDDNAAWSGIGTTDIRFSEIFNGQNHKVSGFTSANALFPFVDATAQISDLTLEGDVTYDVAGIAANTNVAPFAQSSKGKFINCTSAVNVTLINSGDKISNEVRTAGVIAYMNGGEITSCSYSGSINCEALSSSAATRIGGLVGYINAEGAYVNGCTMSGCINMSASLTGACYWGGIVGSTASPIEDCITTEEAIISISNSEKLRLGGIVGYISSGTNKTPSVIGCANNASITVDCNTEKSGTYSNVGGVVGRNDKVPVTDCDNAGAITITAGPLLQYVGGVIGNNTGEVISCDNTAAITLKETTEGKTRYFGGVVGYSEGNISVCTNSGNISSPAMTANINSSKYAPHVFGGIVGYLKGTAFSDCFNSGRIRNYYFCNSQDINTATVTGGIAGIVTGTVEARVVVKNCVNKTASEIAGKRGWIGGVFGFCEYADMSDCDNIVPIVGSAYFCGGICGQMQNSTLTESNAECDITSTQNKAAGGVCGMVTETASISSCTYKGIITNLSGTTVKGVAGGVVGAIGAEGVITTEDYTSGSPVIATVLDNKFAGSIRETVMTLDNIYGILGQEATTEPTISGNELLQ